ncbi:type A2 lantipeptide [Streptomyces sp. 8N706]|uniref:type A2 lantipeptide n=1 Tax=Streptomyces sp. 8N706 TaxID=3457416 RepID=UPI003FD0DC5A
MRNDFTPQVETREIADSDLDNVSGGLVGQVVGTALGTVGTVDAALPTVADVNGLAAQTTGLNPAGIAASATGL